MEKKSMRRELQTVDTNVILRIILDDVPIQRKKALSLIMNGGIYHVPMLAITEVIFTLERGEYKMPRKRIYDNMGRLLKNSCFDYNRDVIDDSLDMYNGHPTLSFNDCVLAIEASRAERAPLWTFDRDLAKQGKFAREIE